MKIARWYDAEFVIEEDSRRRSELDYRDTLEGILFRKTDEYLLIYNNEWIKWMYSGHYQTKAVQRINPFRYIKITADDPVELTKYDKIYIPPKIEIHDKINLDEIDIGLLIDYVNLLFGDPVMLYLVKELNKKLEDKTEGKK